MTEAVPDFASTDPAEYDRAFALHLLEATPEHEPEGWDEAWGPEPTKAERAAAAGIRDDPILERLGARHLWDISRDPPGPLLIDRLDPAGHSILYGTGGVGKGVLTSTWIGQLVGAGHRVLIADYENHPDEWARRIAGLHGLEVLDGVLHVAPLAAAWQGKRGSLWTQAGELRALAEAWSATYLVVDSIVPACGATDPTKPEAAAQYAGALELIGRPALSLAHVTKAESLAYPFGSAFWHNLARVTWSIAKIQDQAIIANRKHNNGQRLGRFAVTVTWRDGVPGEVWERPYAQVLADAIADVLSDGPLTAVEVVDGLNADVGEDDAPVKADSVRAALRRGIQARRFTVAGDGTGARYNLVEVASDD